MSMPSNDSWAHRDVPQPAVRVGLHMGDTTIYVCRDITTSTLLLVTTHHVGSLIHRTYRESTTEERRGEMKSWMEKVCKNDASYLVHM